MYEVEVVDSTSIVATLLINLSPTLTKPAVARGDARCRDEVRYVALGSK